MTREEAINQLKDFTILHREQHGWDVSTLNALDMALKALEHEPCDDPGEISDGYHTFCKECETKAESEDNI